MPWPPHPAKRRLPPRTSKPVGSGSCLLSFLRGPRSVRQRVALPVVGLQRVLHVEAEADGLDAAVAEDEQAHAGERAAPVALKRDAGRVLEDGVPAAARAAVTADEERLVPVGRVA